MAEIKIKKKSPVWPYIVVLLIVVAVIVYFFVYADTAMIDGDRPHIGHDEQIENTTGENIEKIRPVEIFSAHEQINESEIA